MTYVRDIDPSAKGKIRCLNCKHEMDVKDALASGDSMICPVCGEWEDFMDIGSFRCPYSTAKVWCTRRASEDTDHMACDSCPIILRDAQ